MNTRFKQLLGNEGGRIWVKDSRTVPIPENKFQRPRLNNERRRNLVRECLSLQPGK